MDAVVSWKNPTLTRGETITQFTIDIIGKDGSTQSRTVQANTITNGTASGGSCSYIVTGLSTGGTYQFRVTPKNAAGGPDASELSNEVQLGDAPKQVTSLSVEAKDSGKLAPDGTTKVPVASTLVVKWQKPERVATSPEITEYYIRMYRSKLDDVGQPIIGEEITNMKKTVTVTDTNQTEFSYEFNKFPDDTLLKNGETYFFTVTPHNLVGDGAESAARSGRPESVPAQVTVVKPTTEGLAATATDQLKVTWEAPEDNGRPITKYRVLLYNEGGMLLGGNTPPSSGVDTAGQWEEYTTDQGVKFRVHYPTDRTKTEATITGLRSGRRYQIGVRASNLYGEYGYDTLAWARTLSGPEQPRNVQGESGGETGTLSITWDDPLENGGRDITAYQILIYKKDRVTETDPDELVKLATGAGSVHDAEYDLDENADMTVRSLVRTVDELKELWGNEKITHYVTRKPMLTTGEMDYGVFVRAINEVGNGDWSEVITASAIGRPHVVEDLTATITEAEVQEDGTVDTKEGLAGTSLQIQWKSPSDTAVAGRPNPILGNGGAEIEGYRMRVYELDPDAADEESRWVPVDLQTRGYTPPTGGDQYTAALPVKSKDAGTLQDMALVGMLERGHTYKVAITAVNVKGESPVAESVVTLWKLPQEGAWPTAKSNDEYGELTVNWRGTQDDGTLKQTALAPATPETSLGYKVYYKKIKNRDGSDVTGGAYVSDGEIIPRTATENGIYTHTVGKLENGATYEVYVAAVTKTGESDPGRTDLMKTTGVPAGAAVAPVLGDIHSSKSSAIIRTLTQDKDDGGAAVTTFRIYAQEMRMVGDKLVEAGQRQFVRSVPNVGSATEPMTDLTVPNLINGKWYRITVTSVNGIRQDGDPRESEHSNGVDVLVGLPEAPTNLTAKPGPTVTAMTAKMEPANGNGSTILRYWAYTRKKGSSEWIRYGQSFTPEEYGRAVITLIDSGEDVEICFTAENWVGESDKSEIATVKPGTPGAPELSAQLNRDSESVTLSWPAADSNGVPLIGYTVMTSKDGSSFVKTADIPYVKDQQTYSVSSSGLARGSTYQYKVIANGALGDSADSNVEEIRYGVPDAPTDLSVTAGDGILDISFKAPAYAGLDKAGGATGSITGYVIYTNNNERAATITGPDESGLYHTTLTGLTNGTKYSVQVAARNNCGLSTRTPSQDGTPATVPGAPRDVVATVVSDTEVFLNWKAPEFDGGERITDYTVEVYEDEEGKTLVAGTGTKDLDTDKRTVTVTGLEAGKTYYFGVRAVNKAVTAEKIGAVGITKRPAMTFEKPGKPKILSWTSEKNPAVPGKYNLIITWEQPEGGGTEVLGYKIWVGNSCVGGDTKLLPASTRSFSIPNLSNRNYTIRVEAFNKVCNENLNKYGGGAVSDPETIKVGTLAAPVLSGHSTEDSIELQWTAVDGAKNYYVYDLQTYIASNAAAGRTVTVEDALLAIRSNPLGMTFDETADTEFSYGSGETDSGVHYYVVRAVGETASASGYLSEVCEITLGGAVAPVLQSVDGNYRSVDVTFTTLGSDGLNGSTLKGYQILIDGEPAPTDGISLDGNLLAAEDTWIRDTALLNRVNETVTLHVAGVSPKEEHLVTVRAITMATDGTILNGQGPDARKVTAWGDPTAPVVLDETSGNGTFQIRAEVSDGNGREIAGYRVAYLNSEHPDDPEGWIEKDYPVESSAVTVKDGIVTIQVDNVANGYLDGVSMLRDYTVKGYTAKGNQKWPSETDGETHQVVTGIPTAPVITRAEAGENQIAISYTEPEMDPSIAVINYEIIARPVDENKETKRQPNIYGLSGEVGGLEANISYKVTVRALNQLGYGPESKSVEVKTGTPGTPNILDAVAGDGSIYLRWSESKGTTTYPLTGYRVYYTDTRDNTSYVQNVDKDQAKNEITLTGLVNGVEYEIKVVGVNENGESPASQSVNLMPGAAPGTPTLLSAQSTADGTGVELSFLAPETDGGLAIDEYLITGEEDRAVIVKADTGTKDPDTGRMRYQATVGGLTPGETYHFTIQAHNIRDYSTAVETGDITLFTVPDTPRWRGIGSQNMMFTAKWDAPNDGGSEIIGYNLYLSGDGIDGEIPITQQPLQFLEDESQLYLDEENRVCYTAGPDLDNGVTLALGANYKLSIQAVNAVGPSQKSSVMDVDIVGQTRDSVPGRMGKPTVEAGNGQLTIHWRTPTVQGTLQGIAGYHIYYREKGSGTDYIEKVHVGDDNNVEVLTGLENSKTYEICIAAENYVGLGARSAVVEEMPKQIEPPVMGKMSYQNNAGMNTMTIKWDPATTSELGGTVTYRVYINTPENEIPVGEATSYQMSVVGGQKYKIWIVAHNNGGDSCVIEPSSPHMQAQNWLNVEPTGELGAEPTISLDVDCDGELDESIDEMLPTAPTELTADVQTDKITLNWTVPYAMIAGEQVPFENLDLYEITVNGALYKQIDALQEDGTPNTTIDFQEELDEGQFGIKGGVYLFQVRAVNRNGEGPYSDVCRQAVQTSGAPTKLTATPGDGKDQYRKVTLSWTKPIATKEIKSYVVQTNGSDSPEQYNTTDTSREITVEPDKNYIFRVYARYDGGEESKTSGAVQVSTAVPTPGVPVDLTAAVQDGTIALNWTAPEGSALDGYYLYVNNEVVKDESGKARLIEQTNYPYTPTEPGEYVFNVSAVYAVDECVKESPRSNSAAASTKQIDPGDPAKPENLTVESTWNPAVGGGVSFTLHWNAVTQCYNDAKELIDLAEGTDVSYTAYVSKNNGPITTISGIPYPDSASVWALNYSDSAQGGDSYVFQICATVDGKTSERSDPVTCNLSELELPAAPTGLTGRADASTRKITLTWDKVEGAEGYRLYSLDTLLSESDDDTVGTISKPEENDSGKMTCTYAYGEGDTDKSFVFTVAAWNKSTKKNSAGKVGESELSDFCTVSTGQNIDIGEIPTGPAAPDMVRSVHNQKQNKIRVYWTAPTLDIENQELGEKAKDLFFDTWIQENDAVDAPTYKLGSANYDEESGLWFCEMDIESNDYPIQTGTRYTVTVKSMLSFTTEEGVTGTADGVISTWVVARDLNLDTNDDWVADQNPDATGDGEQDAEAGTKVTLTAKISAGSADAFDVHVWDNSQNKTDVALEDSVEVSYDAATKTLTASYRVNAGTGEVTATTPKYTVRIGRAGYTWFEITDIPMLQSVAEINVNDTITLYAGDANGDGRINATDLAVVKANQGKNAAEVDGDIDGNNRINATDMAVTKANQGKRETHKAYTAVLSE